ncbi:hypothetical protein EVAR_63194_1 [Eumeta japonica]|uniref:Uncharacterized protein n=1 Tax=Eumeta variegata TaxID=151549 RepID=A0A4C1ZZJ9_EUMVA|nr:hypothetical protein EVAR_63194_1 [Eumeta japonica]
MILVPNGHFQTQRSPQCITDLLARIRTYPMEWDAACLYIEHNSLKIDKCTTKPFGHNSIDAVYLARVALNWSVAMAAAAKVGKRAAQTAANFH